MPRIPLLVVSLFFACGGLAHFVFLNFFVMAMPGYLPFHEELVLISGVFELLGAIGLLIPKTRLLSACGLIALAVAVFPANMNMAINSHLYGDLSPLFIYLRLPFQLVIIGFIWWSVADERNEKGWFSDESPLMQNLTYADLDKACADFVNTFQGVLSWKWDDRFNVVMAEFDVSDESDVLTSLEYYFGYYWDASTICTAPPSIQCVVKRFGGLHSGQLLLSTNPSKGVFLYCVLWPWGCGKKISIRLSSSDIAGSQEAKPQHVKHLKQWFGLKEDGADSGWVKIDQTVAK